MSKVITKVKKGLTFRSVVADANALWEVRNLVSYDERGDNDPIWQCGCIEAGYETHDVFRESKILSLANVGEARKEMLSSNDAYYKSLNIGDVVHYHDGFGQFVRCEVVDEEGSHVLKRIGLVGKWKEYDLPNRTRTGEINIPPRCRMGTTFKPNYGTIYECDKFSGNSRVVFDPTKLDLIDLSVPEMTEKQIAVAASWTAVESVRKLLAVSQHNPISILESAKKIIDAALKEG
jgi:hypothetical protein